MRRMILIIFKDCIMLQVMNTKVYTYTIKEVEITILRVFKDTIILRKSIAIMISGGTYNSLSPCLIKSQQ